MAAAQVGALSVFSTSGSSQSFNPLGALPRNRFAALVLRVAGRINSIVFPCLSSAGYRHAHLPRTLMHVSSAPGEMIERLAGVAGGLGLFIVGMWLLTENLEALATRRLRRVAGRWTANPFSALAWGAFAGAITRSMSAMTFIVVSILRSGLITTRGSLALILGGSVGVSALVVIVTFDIKVISLYVLGLAGAAVVSERLSRFRPVAASFLGGAMLIVGLVLLTDAAAPLAEQPWFRDMLERTGNSLALAFCPPPVSRGLRRMRPARPRSRWRAASWSRAPHSAACSAHRCLPP